MKWFFAIATALLVTVTGRAQSQDSLGNWIAMSRFTVGTNASATAVTNLYVAHSLNHTIHIVSTNDSTAILSGSIDSTNYAAFATNKLTAGVVAETAVSKKMRNLRISLSGTNDSVGVYYMGK